MDKFFQKFAWDRKNGNGPKVAWICKVTFDKAHLLEAHFHSLGNYEEVVKELMMVDSG